MRNMSVELLDERGRTRRRLLKAGAGTAALAIVPAAALAARPRALYFYHTHTGEQLHITYAEGGILLPDALDEVNHFLRDFRSGETHPIDPGLLDTLHRVQHLTGGRGPFEIVSAYRSPQTNQMLSAASNGVAKRSLHMQGRAVDVRLRGVATARLHNAALDLRAGGVGYYPDADFVHLDTGPVRSW